MAYYKAGKTMDLHDSHNALIIPPLAVILVSCFIFVLVQPNAPKNTGPAASSHTKQSQSKPQAALPMAQNTPLPTLEPTVLVDQASASAGSDTRNTMSPQSATATTSSLQAANANNQKSNLRINVPNLNKR